MQDTEFGVFFERLNKAEQWQLNQKGWLKKDSTPKLVN